MTLQDIRNQIEQSIANKHKVKVYFRLETRTPLYGKFVRLNDAAYLELKNMYRFVNEPVIEKFDKTNSYEIFSYTRILTIESILFVKEVVYVTQ